MHFHKDAIHSARHACACDIFDKQRIATRCRSQSSRSLQAVRHVINYRVTKVTHDGKPAKIYYEIVIAEARPAFGYDDAMIILRYGFLYSIFHILRREKLPLIDV